MTATRPSGATSAALAVPLPRPGLAQRLREAGGEPVVRQAEALGHAVTQAGGLG